MLSKIHFRDARASRRVAWVSKHHCGTYIINVLMLSNVKMKVSFALAAGLFAAVRLAAGRLDGAAAGRFIRLQCRPKCAKEDPKRMWANATVIATVITYILNDLDTYGLDTIE